MAQRMTAGCKHLTHRFAVPSPLERGSGRRIRTFFLTPGTVTRPREWSVGQDTEPSPVLRTYSYCTFLSKLFNRVHANRPPSYLIPDGSLNTSSISSGSRLSQVLITKAIWLFRSSAKTEFLKCLSFPNKLPELYI